MAEKLKLGLACGKFCAECGDSVALDAQGKFLCFSCGKFVQTADDTIAKPVQLREKKKFEQTQLFKEWKGLPE